MGESAFASKLSHHARQWETVFSRVVRPGVKRNHQNSGGETEKMARNLLPEWRQMTIGELASGTALDQLVPAPCLVWEARALTLCDHLYQTYVLPGNGGLIPKSAFALIPKWVFLE